MTGDPLSLPNLVVVERRPWLVPVVVATWLISVVIVALLSSYLAGKQAREVSAELAVENNRLVQATELADANAEQHLQDVARLTASAEIDQAAAEQSRLTIVALQAQVQQLQAEISFYRGLMDSNVKRKDVSVGKITLTPGSQPERVRYSVVVQQVAANHKVVTGSLVITLIGRDDSGVKELALNSVSEQVSEDSIKLKFKYFQNIEGELELPEGFQPDRLEWQLDSSVSGKSRGEQAWLIKE